MTLVMGSLLGCTWFGWKTAHDCVAAGKPYPIKYA